MDATAKREALAALLKARARKAEAYPLSDPQLSIWFQQHLEPDSAAYNMPLAFCLHGRMRDPLAMVDHALGLVVRRHPALRTVFLVENDEPLQCVLDDVPVELGLRDIGQLHSGDWRAAVPGLCREQAHRPFDLAKGPLFRFELLRLSDELHILLATFHHIVMDGWSIGVFLKDFALAFIANARNQPLEFDPLPLSYQQHVERQRSPGGRARVARNLDYWQARLEGAPRALDLPIEYQRPPSNSFSGATHGFEIPIGVSRKLTQLGQAHGATGFMTLLATFYALMARICGQSDVVLGVSVSNREEKDYRGMLGLFSDVLPMRARVDPGASFTRLLRDTRESCLADYEHSSASITRIIERVRPARDTDRGLLFQAGFDFQNTPWPAVLGDHVSLLNGDTGSAKLDLNLNLSKVQDTLSAVFEYNTSLFSGHAIKRIERCYQALLASIVEQPHLPLDQLAILDADERNKVLHEWNQDGPAVSGEANVLALIREHADRAPDKAALEDAGKRTTYKELETRSNGIAHALLAAGAGEDDRIGLCLRRSAAYVLALLGVSKTGASFVPLDPDLSPARRDHMVADAGIRLVVTTRELASRWLDDPRVELVFIDDIDAAQAVPTRPLPGPRADQTAYLVYTSGTTGNPKGVMVSHGGLFAFARAAAATFAIGEHDRVLQFASISFDTSLEEIFPALVSGATLVISDGDMAGSGERFLGACRDRAISVLNLPTAFWHEIVEVLRQQPACLPPEVRLVVIGGEAAAPRAVSRWLETVGRDVRLLNTYGPTETTVSVTAAELSSLSRPERLLSVPIGRPYPGVRIYILDKHGCPVPPGLHGEIVVGGPTLAKGYNGAPAATAEKFVPDPFAGVEGARMYRTGDFGRYLEDGTIEFAGRRDEQVKILGFRVELGEIESTLLHCPGISQAAAILRPGEPPAEGGIAAFVVFGSDHAPLSVADLRAWTRRQLPPHMVPSHFAVVDALPTTVNGKVDKEALGGLVVEAAERPAGDRSPRTPEEAMLASVWSNVLGIEHVGIHENFFELGGHSLLLIRMLSRVRRVFGVDVPLSHAFEAPTVARLAQAIGQLRDTADFAGVPPIEARPRPADVGQWVFPQSLSQQRMWFLDRLAPTSSAYNNASAMRVEGELDLAVLQGGLDALVLRHEILRTVFGEHDGHPVQIVRQHADVRLTIIDLAPLDEAQRQSGVSRLIAEDAQRPFDLESGPLLRMCVVRCSEREHVLIFNWHHIITDAGSLPVFVGELAELYGAAISGREPSLAPIALQFADFAQWESRHANAPAIAKQLQYWREKLAGAPPALGFPVANPGADHAGGPCRRAQGRIPATTTRGLAAIARANDCTLFIVCLAAFKLLMSRYSGETDIVVGTPISGRSRAELESVIGFFINTLAMRTDLGAATTFPHVLQRVRETAVEAYAHQHAPFERVVREVQRDRNGSAAPLFNVSFVFENRNDVPVAFPGASIVPLERGLQDAKFSLSLAMRETADGLACEWEAPAGLFDASTLDSMAGHFQVLLDGIADAPLSALSELPLLTSTQARRLLDTWSDGGTGAVEAVCLHELFERSAAATPAAVALVAAGCQLSYRELNERANRLARHLRRQGVGPDLTVGLCLERSPELAVAILGVWKAGGAYVPLDPNCPDRRLARILEDTGSSWLLCQSSLAGRFAGTGAAVLVMDAGDVLQALAAESAENLEVGELGLAPHHLAYVTFTSGSTGRPKGVMVEHRHAVNLGESLRPWLAATGVTGACRWAWNASYAFDASLQALLQWADGSTVHLLPEDVRRDPAQLRSYLREHRIDVLDATPLQVEGLLDSVGQAQALPALVVGGEGIAPALWKRIAGHYQGGSRQALNVYGPTETTVDATVAVIGGDRPTIGRPLRNVRCYVLDRHDQLQPEGLPGELCIGGAGVARGYVDRPRLTDDRFVEIELGGVRDRVYRTGDVVRWLPTGELEFIGRADGQVKIRGYRVELGEIEHELRQLPGVDAAVVAARDGGDGSRELVAYVVPAPDRVDGGLDDFRQALRATLPEYMVPAHLVALEALPLTPNGKLDSAALPAPNRINPTRAHVAPANPTELWLARTWAELFDLDVAQVGAEANFFVLGGHSLLLMRMISAIRFEFGVELPLKALFEATSLREAAALIVAGRSDATAATPEAEAPVEETEW